MILGTDISHWEDAPDTPKEIDFEMMKRAGANFVIFKVSQQNWLDRVFRISWAKAKGILPRGAFMYLDNRMPGLDQAKFFVNALKADPPDGPYEVDFEDRLNIDPYSKPNGHLWNACMHIVKEAGSIPWIYTSPDYWKIYGTDNPAWAQFPLHIANYGVLHPFIPKPWAKAKAWQFTDRGPGGIYGVEAKGIDLDQYLDTEEQFKIDFKIETPPAPPITLEQRVSKLEECAKKMGCYIEI
jgi:GH25 family lysozyme M1 (1,4-beta-N-acetylmuramidase)